MADQSEELKKLELISAARKIVNAEYIKQRSDEYNRWLLANKDAFKNPNPAMPFSPPSVAFIPFQSSVRFPTEDDVVKRAVELYKLTNLPTTEAELTVIEPEPVSEPVIEAGVTPPEELTDIQLRDALVAEIYKIYEDVGKPVAEPISEPEPVAEPVDTLLTSTAQIVDINHDLNVIPQPAEILAAESTGPLSSVLQRIQELKNSWIKKPGDKV